MWVVGSSLQGFALAVADAYTFWKAIEDAAAAKCLRVLLTAPEASHYRDKPEGRNRGQIRREIGESLNKLLTTCKVPKKYIRLYSSSPTVTAIATSKRMLINPFPYCQSSFHCFCLIVRSTTPDGSDIYGQYIEKHFKCGWDRARPLSIKDEALAQSL